MDTMDTMDDMDDMDDMDAETRRLKSPFEGGFRGMLFFVPKSKWNKHIPRP